MLEGMLHNFLQRVSPHPSAGSPNRVPLGKLPVLSLPSVNILRHLAHSLATIQVHEQQRKMVQFLTETYFIQNVSSSIAF